MIDRVGQRLGNYRLLRLLGRGSFAEVYLGEHLHLGTQAAIKILHVQFTSQDSEQLRSEARLIARLVHPLILRILDFVLEDDIPFLIIEYAPGGTLRQRHPIGTLVPLDTIVSYVKQLAEAVHYIHEQGWVHRDIKPENLVFGRNNEVLLTDFGLTIPTQRSYSQQTQEIIGTMAYMAPEQIQGHPIQASDQYALGIVAYEWLSGDTPFHGSYLEITEQHMSVPPPSLRARVPAISPGVEQVVLKALAKNPQQRFANVKAFALALEEAFKAESLGRILPVASSEHPAGYGQKGSSLGNLPTGTVTMLFTDIEGSTHLLHQVGDRYADVLAQCRYLLSTAFQQWGGYEVDTQGDAFFVAFARATDAVLAAVDAQRAFAAHPWPEGVAVRVRMGLHTGEPARTSEGYVGLDVHRAARIMSAAYGGQVLLSQTTCNLVEQDLPEDLSLRDLGEHRLKDLGRPRRLFQLVIPDLPADFPPLKTLDTYPNNLPMQHTLFIGREQELAAVGQLLRREDVRLVTLSGPGGTGKTRLGVQVAAELTDSFADGVFFVNLAPVTDTALVVPTIAEALGMRETGGQPLRERLKGELQQKQMVLLLDNFEQVVSAAVQVVDLLTACPKLKVLVTSREALHVRAEQEFTVPPLPLPNLKHLPDLAALSHNAAVALFISRAQAVKPEFQVTNANVRAIVEICARLDGLPLAIELAAARTKLFSPQALLERLSQRLAVLTSGARDAPARQQTLRNTIAWSYYLLHADEQQFFRRLSIFVGGCTLEAAEAVCQDMMATVLDVVASLIDKSLLHQAEQEGEEPRLTMLETVREYGQECLHENGEAEMSQRVHALHYLALAEEAEPHLKGAQQVQWWRRLEREQGNLRAALKWLIEQQEGKLALRLGGALWWFWNIRGYWSEGWHWLEAALALPQAQERTAGRAKALVGAAECANRLGNPRVHPLNEESVTIYRELGDMRGLAESLGGLAWALLTQNDSAAACTLLEESLALAREVGDPWILANALHEFGSFKGQWQGDFKSARPFLEESLALYRVLKDHHELFYTLLRLIEVRWSEGNFLQAEALAREGLALARELDNEPDITRALFWLGVAKSFQGDVEQALVLFKEGLILARERDDKGPIGNIQLTFGGIVLHQGDLQLAESCAQESLTLYRELGRKSGAALALALLGEIRRRQGDFPQARAACTEGVLLARGGGSRYSMNSNLISLAMVAADEGQPEQAARLFGSAEPWWTSQVYFFDPFERADYERAVERVREQLGEKAFATAWAEGRTMTPEQVLAAQGPAIVPMPDPTEQPSPDPAKSADTYPDNLTGREVEVLRLLAQGLTDAQIADQLVISPRTVNTHLTSIYGKIQVSSRSAATRYAIENQLG